MDKLDRLGWVVHRTYEIGPARFGLRTTSRTFGEWLDRALGRYRVDGEEFPHYSVVVPEGNGDGSARKAKIFYRMTAPIVRTFDIHTLGRAFLTEMACHQAARVPDAIYLESVLLAGHGRTVLVPAPLMAHLAKQGRRAADLGISFPIARYTMVDTATGRVIPPPRTLDVPSGLMDLLPPASTNGHREPERIVVEDPISVDAVCVLGPIPVPVTTVSRAYALNRIGVTAGNIQQLGGAGLQALGRMIESAETYCLGDAPSGQMLASVDRVLRGERPGARLEPAPEPARR